jgi:hypothetical protein
MRQFGTITFRGLLVLVRSSQQGLPGAGALLADVVGRQPVAERGREHLRDPAGSRVEPRRRDEQDAPPRVQEVVGDELIDVLVEVRDAVFPMPTHRKGRSPGGDA